MFFSAPLVDNYTIYLITYLRLLFFLKLIDTFTSGEKTSCVINSLFEEMKWAISLTGVL